jgi:hypothetical protein
MYVKAQLEQRDITHSLSLSLEFIQKSHHLSLPLKWHGLPVFGFAFIRVCVYVFMMEAYFSQPAVVL